MEQPKGTAVLGGAASLITPAASSFTCAPALRNGRDEAAHLPTLKPQRALVLPGELSSTPISQNAAKRPRRLTGTRLRVLIGHPSQSLDPPRRVSAQNAAGASRIPPGDRAAAEEGAS
jgi:hypothetical protein